MDGIKNNGTVVEGYDTKMLECSCDSRFIPLAQDKYLLRSFSEEREDMLNETPRISYHNPSLHVNLERRLDNRHSFQEMASDHSSARSTVTNESSSPVTATELVKEITTLELEIVHLEQYLLSLYRTAFDYYKKDSFSLSCNYSMNSPCGMLIRECTKQMMNHENYEFKSDLSLGETNCGVNSTDKDLVLELWNKENSSACPLQRDSDTFVSYAPTNNPQTDILEVGSDQLCNSDQFRGSNVDHTSIVPCKLSEDILRCIAAIYCKLANAPKSQKDKMNVGASSTLEAAANPSPFGLQKFNNKFYIDMMEIPRISVDGERFRYASKMLHIFRILIKQLKKIDPTKMAYDEQIAFWLNIHNALVMHAFLAYGRHHMRIKSSIFKAAYNIGSRSINAFIIRVSILGCQPHFSASMQWLDLLSPALKFKKKKQKHPYALDRPQPLAYFAMSQGAFSDPPVRIYNAKHILQNLELARNEFIQNNVKVLQSKASIILPKILCCYMKDSSLEISKLLKIVVECMPEDERRTAREFLRVSSNVPIVWSKYNSSFRYMIHKEIGAKEERGAFSRFVLQC